MCQQFADLMFKGSMFMEREAQMKLLDGLLFKAKNATKKRLLIVAVASSGMGKSAFVDEYCRTRLLLRTAEDEDENEGGPIIKEHLQCINTQKRWKFRKHG